MADPIDTNEKQRLVNKFFVELIIKALANKWDLNRVLKEK